MTGSCTTSSTTSSTGSSATGSSGGMEIGSSTGSGVTSPTASRTVDADTVIGVGLPHGVLSVALIETSCALLSLNSTFKLAYHEAVP